ncbi:hypothetical protein QTP70_021529, partial [Hemibagrus guttatus]
MAVIVNPGLDRSVDALQCYACNIQGQRYVDVGCSSPEVITCSHFYRGFKQRFCIRTESNGQSSQIHRGPTSQLTGLKGSAANILVPDTTAHLQGSSGAHASMGQ